MRVTMKAHQLNYLLDIEDSDCFCLKGQNGTLSLANAKTTKTIVPIKMKTDFATSIYPHTIEKLAIILTFAHPEQKVKLTFLHGSAQIKITL
jgi:hypothetical protein